MPQVASETKTYAPNAPLLYSARPPQAQDRAQDRAQSTPFQSLLGDSTPAPASRPATSDDNAPRAEQPDNAQPAARGKAANSNDSADSASKTNPNSADNADSAATPATKAADGTAQAGKPAGDIKVTGGDKPATDLAPPTGGDDAKPAADGKAADAQTPAGLVAAVAAVPIPAIAVAEAAATAPALASAAVAQTAAATAGVAVAATAKTKPDAPANLPAGSDKAADDAKLAEAKVADKTVPPSHGETKPQAADIDKDAVAHARGEVAANDNHAADAHAAAAITPDAAAPKAGADASQAATLTAPSQNTPPATAPLAAAPLLTPPAAAIPLAAVGIEIASKALAGKNHFEIRLDPPELGRIEVRLNVDRDGNVTSRVIADRSDTLDLMRRDASGLERALQDAGLKTAGNGLQFSLRDHSAGQRQADDGGNTARLAVEDQTPRAVETMPRIYSRLAGQGRGIDIQV